MDEWETLQTAFRSLHTIGWNVVFEFELPFEGGRRPDVVVLAGEALLVLEFKGSPIIDAAQIDQAAAYARDLAEYHEASHWRDVQPILVATALHGPSRLIRDVTISPVGEITGVLEARALSGTIAFQEWLAAPYTPLPSLVSAARRIFQNERLPHVRRALAARIPEVVKLVDDIAAGAEREEGRRAVFVTGVPGAGKTLVGLRVVYERADLRARSTFLSGNGPLVKVLQDALQSTVFVRDLHKFLTSFGLTDRIPDQHVLVFDEAQRAWDAEYMLEKKKVAHSEPELLVRIGERLPDWAALIGLVGTGQSIYSGEEGGLPLWQEALASAEDTWEVHCPPSVAPEFAGLNLVIHPELELKVPLRARRAEHLHEWVAALLAGNLGDAERLSGELAAAQFPVYITRDLDETRDYARDRYQGEPDARFGLVASSHAKNLERHGVDNSWIATSRMNVAKWFNAPPNDARSCCALTQPVTEFGCQGLELELPIVCWGDDVEWHDSGWVLRPLRRRYPLANPQELLRNTYRVLLTRGRDGMLIWVPPDADLDETSHALELAGAISGWPTVMG